MNKILIIWIFAVVLMCSFASAVSFDADWNYAGGNYSFDCETSPNTNTTYFTAGAGLNKYTTTTTWKKTGNSACMRNATAPNLNPTSTLYGLYETNNHSIGFWNYINATSSTNWGTLMFYVNSGDVLLATKSGSGNFFHYNTDLGIPVPLSEWFFLTFYHTTGNSIFVYMTRDDGTAGGNTTFLTKNINAFDYRVINDGEAQNWVWDSLTVWQGNISDFPKSASAPSVIDFLNLTSISPSNISQFNYNPISINTTANSTSNFNCSLYLDGKLNQTINSYTAGNDVLVNFTKTLNEGTHYAMINCSSNWTSKVTSNNTIYIDITNPTITTNFINFSYFINKNITGSFNTSDNDGIHTFNLSINGVSIFNRTGINNQTYNYTLNIPQSSPVVEGINTLSLYIADGHTANELISANSYDYNKGLVFHDSLEFIFKEPYIDGRIKIYQKDGSLFDVWDTKAEIDKYSFTFEPFKKTDRYTFIVEADSTLFISNIPSSKFKKWIIFNEHWLDLYPYNIIDIRRIKDNIVEIDVNNIDEKTEKLEFNSIGDLNIVYYNVSFLSGSASVLYTSPEVETVDTSIKLNITAYNSSYFNSDNITAWLYYNGTNYTTTKTVVDNTVLFSKTVNTGKNTNTFENRTFNWVYVINTTYANTSFTNQSIIKMIVSNCSEAPANTYFALNFSTKDLNNNEVYTTQSAIFYYWKGTDVLSSSMYYSSSVTSAYCIYPNETIYANYQIVFNNASYAQVNYFQNAKSLDYITEYKTIYLTTLTGSTSISTYVVDEYDNALQGYIVEAYFYEIATNSYQLLSSEKTDLEGKAKFNLDVSIYQYKFLVYNTNGTQVYTSATGKLFDTSYTFRVNLGSSTSNIYAQLYNLDYTLTASLSKKTCNLSWNDFSDLISKIELQVDKLNVSSNENQTLGIVSSALANSILGYDLVAYNNATWLCSAYATANSDGKRYFLKSVSLDLREEWQIFGDSEALFMSFIFVGTMAFMGLFIGAEASLILMLLGIITFQLLGFLKLGWGIGITGLIILVGILVLIVKRR